MDAKKTWALTEDMMHGHFIADASSDNDLKYALRHKLPGQSYKNGMGIRYALANEGFVRGFKHVGNNTFQAQNLKGLTISVETEPDGDRLRVRNVWFNDSKPAKDAPYWEDPKKYSPSEILKEINETQVKLQRMDKSSPDYAKTKKWFDALIAEISKRNRKSGVRDADHEKR